MRQFNPQVQIMQLRREKMELLRQLIELQESFNIQKAFTVRQCAEVAQMVLHRSFGFGGERCRQFEPDFLQTFVEWADLVVEDSKDDEDLAWSIDRFDRLLAEARGEAVPPFKDRYTPELLAKDVPVVFREGGGGNG